MVISPLLGLGNKSYVESALEAHECQFLLPEAEIKEEHPRIRISRIRISDLPMSGLLIFAFVKDYNRKGWIPYVFLNKQRDILILILSYPYPYPILILIHILSLFLSLSIFYPYPYPYPYQLVLG